MDVLWEQEQVAMEERKWMCVNADDHEISMLDVATESPGKHEFTLSGHKIIIGYFDEKFLLDNDCQWLLIWNWEGNDWVETVVNKQHIVSLRES